MQVDLVVRGRLKEGAVSRGGANIAYQMRTGETIFECPDGLEEYEGDLRQLYDSLIKKFGHLLPYSAPSLEASCINFRCLKNSLEINHDCMSRMLLVSDSSAQCI